MTTSSILYGISRNNYVEVIPARLEGTLRDGNSSKWCTFQGLHEFDICTEHHVMYGNGVPGININFHEVRGWAIYGKSIIQD